MISVGFKTDRGKARSGNEDSVFVLPAEQLYIVADGVGGHNSGELASRMAVSYMAQYAALNPLSEIQDTAKLRDYFQNAVSGANQLIFTSAYKEAGHVGMATTMVMCHLRENKAYVVNVGDSRAYLLREGSLLQITKDHTWVNEMIDRGMLTEQEAKDHPDKNMITKALGGEPTVSPDFFVFDTYPGDILILCTDGLYGEVGEDYITEIAGKAKTMHRLSKELVDEANRQGGKDNISVICISIQ